METSTRRANKNIMLACSPNVDFHIDFTVSEHKKRLL